jgi:hypothetical protein
MGGETGLIDYEMKEQNLKNPLKSRPWLWLGAVILLTAFMWCYRRPDALTYPQFWAEDGVIFFADAYHHGFSSLWMDHGGYYHLVPRVVALLGLSLIPLVSQPLFYNLFCLFGIMAIIAYLWFRLPFSPEKKFFMALSLTWAPVANEVMLSLAGFHFILSLCPIILLLGGPPKNGIEWLIDLFVLLICGLTGPFLTLFFPLLLLVAWENKFQPKSYYFSLVIVAGLTIFPQAFTLTTPSIKRFSLDQPLTIAQIIQFLYLQAIGLFFSPNWFKNSMVRLVISMAVAFAYLGGGIYFMKDVLKRRNWSALTPLLAGLIILSATILLYGSAIIFLNPVEGGPRYFYIPTIMILWTAILGWPSKYLRLMAVLFVYFFVLYSIAYTSRPWVDYQWPDYSARIATEKELTIPINPPGVLMKIKNEQASGGNVGETNSNRPREK